MTTRLAARGARVRSHACESDAGENHCIAVVDYRGSGIDVAAGPSLQPGNARTNLRLSVSGDLSQEAAPSAPYGSWDSVDPLPAGWTSGTRCVTQEPAGCRGFEQLLDASPRVAVPLAHVCAEVRSRMVGSYYLSSNLDSPAPAGGAASCGLLGHRFRTLGGYDGEVLTVTAQALDRQHTALHIRLCQWSHGGCVGVGGR
jgi:hypothetical protein